MLDYVMTMNSDQVFFLSAALMVVVMALAVGSALLNFRRGCDTLGISALLALILEISIVVRSHPTPPGGFGTLIVFPVIDLIALCLVAYMFVTKPDAWKFVVAFALLAQLVAHFSFWHALNSGKGTFPVYILTVNLLATIQKLAAGYAGARDVSVGIVAWLSRRRDGGLRPVHHGSPR